LTVAAPLVAGMAAYLRSLPSRWKNDLRDPRLLKALIKVLQRKLMISGNMPPAAAIPAGKYDNQVPTAWNGQVFEESCLLDTHEANPNNPKASFLLDLNCPIINEIYQNDADKARFTPGGSRNSGDAIQYEPGPPGPLCQGAPALNPRKRAVAAETCGKLCSGLFCVPNSTGYPSDFHDPEDPKYKTITSELSPPTSTGPPSLGDCSKTVSTRCVGSGGRQSCEQVTVCAPPPPAPTCDDTCRDKQKLDHGNPCICNRNGCDANSPSCCQHSTCKPCNCGESGCGVGSPSCCGSGTCQWDRFEWTNGKDSWGRCHIHIHEWHWGNNDNIMLDFESYLNDGTRRSQATVNTDWSRTVTWRKAGSGLPSDISVELSKRTGSLRRDVPPPGSGQQQRDMWQSWDLTFSVGSTKWSSGNRDENRLPFCRVGDWENNAWVTENGVPSTKRPVSIAARKRLRCIANSPSRTDRWIATGSVDRCGLD
jgi:hypothetical protein